MCICSSIFLAELLAEAGAANDTVACLPLLIYLCVLEWGGRSLQRSEGMITEPCGIPE